MSGGRAVGVAQRRHGLVHAWRMMAAIGAMGALSVSLLASSGSAQVVGVDVRVTAAGPGSVIVHGQVTQTFTATNFGSLPAGTVTLHIQLPIGTVLHVSHNPSQGTCQYFAGGTLTCNLTPGATVIPSGAAAFVRVVVKAVGARSESRTAVSAAAADATGDVDVTNNSAAVLLTVTEQPEAVIGSVRHNARLRQGPNLIKGRVNPSVGVKVVAVSVTRGTHGTRTGRNCRAYIPGKGFVARCKGDRTHAFKANYFRVRGQWTVGFRGNRLAPGFYTVQVRVTGTNNRIQRIVWGDNLIRFTVLPDKRPGAYAR